MKLVAFCEAASDFQVLATLVDRVFREDGPRWLSDVLDTAPASIRDWIADGQGRTFFDLHHFSRYADALDVRRPHGHFDGRPGGYGTVMARTVFAIVRALRRKGQQLDAVVLVWDMDQQPAERRLGLDKARAEAESWADFRIAIGCPNAEREAWVLVGFEPDCDAEHERLAEISTELGFSPVHEAHQLDAAHETAKRSPKRILRLLTSDDRDREARCWADTPLETLRLRSADTGLAEFLDEIKTHLLPLLTGSRS